MIWKNGKSTRLAKAASILLSAGIVFTSVPMPAVLAADTDEDASFIVNDYDWAQNYVGREDADALWEVLNDSGGSVTISSAEENNGNAQGVKLNFSYGATGWPSAVPKDSPTIKNGTVDLQFVAGEASSAGFSREGLFLRANSDGTGVYAGYQDSKSKLMFQSWFSYTVKGWMVKDVSDAEGFVAAETGDVVTLHAEMSDSGISIAADNSSSLSTEMYGTYGTVYADYSGVQLEISDNPGKIGVAHYDEGSTIVQSIGVNSDELYDLVDDDGQARTVANIYGTIYKDGEPAEATVALVSADNAQEAAAELEEMYPGDQTPTVRTANEYGNFVIKNVEAGTYSLIIAVDGDKFIVPNAVSNFTATEDLTIDQIDLGVEKPTFTADLVQKESYTTDETVELDATATLKGSGTVSYQWYKDGEAIDGATEAKYTATVGAIGTGAEYYCIAQNTGTSEYLFTTDGNTTRTSGKKSNTVVLSVNKEKAVTPVADISSQSDLPIYAKDILKTQTPITVNVKNLQSDNETETIEKEEDLSYAWYQLPEGEENPSSIAAENRVSASGIAEGCNFWPTESGSYYCVVTNAYRYANTPSECVTEAVDATVYETEYAAEITIKENFPTKTEYETGMTLSLSIEAIDGVTYQWYKGLVTDSVEEIEIEGAENPTYTETLTQAGDYYYYCEVKRDKGTTAIYDRFEVSDHIPITVVQLESAAKPTITTYGWESTYGPIDEGYAEDISLRVSAGISANALGEISYHWYRTATKPEDEEEATLAAFAIEANEVPQSLISEDGKTCTIDTSSAATYYYFCKVDNDNPYAVNPTTSTYTQVAEVIVEAFTQPTIPEISSQPTVGEEIYDIGSTVNLSVDAAIPAYRSGEVSYQWYQANSEGGEGTAISGATESTYSVSTNEAAVAWYYCIVTNTAEGKTTDAATDRVKVVVGGYSVAPVLSAISGAAYTVGDTAKALSAAPTNNLSGTVIYQWYSHAEGKTAQAIAGGTKATLTPSVSAAGTTYYYCVVTHIENGKLTATAQTNEAKIVVTEKASVQTPNVQTLAKGALIVKGSITLSVSDPEKKTVVVKKVNKKNIKKVTIPATVTKDGVVYKVVGIGNKAFKGCKKLRKVTIGANVVSIGKQAFAGDANLKTITFKGKTMPTFGKNAFKGISTKAKVTLPKSLSKKAIKKWKKALYKAKLSKKAVIK